MQNLVIVDSHAHVFTHDMPHIPNPRHHITYDFTTEQYLATLDAHGIAFGVITGFFVWEMQRGGSALWIILGALGLVFGILMLTCLFSSDYGASAAFIRETLLKDELCPSCMEDLRGVEPDEFGLTECPMCTAAWRVPGKREAESVKREV